jgi:hypothetical protein
MTFHDRPDTFAHVLGMSAVYCWVRSHRIFLTESASSPSGMWKWLMALFVVLTFTASLQIGATYCLWVTLGAGLVCIVGKERFPVFPVLTMVAVPLALVVMVKTAFPLAWVGFMENVRQTPFLAGLHVAYWGDLVKVVRTVPGIFLVAMLLPWMWLKQRKCLESPSSVRHALVVFPALAVSLAVIAACLFAIESNVVINITGYLQPVIVAGYLALCAPTAPGLRWRRMQTAGFLAALLLGSVRAVGMSTWGLACAHDVSYSAAIQRVRQELEKQPTNSTVVLSSAYLYEAARHTNVRWLHCDWLVEAKRNEQLTGDLRGLMRQKPARLILTQFDYYRRYKQVLEQAKTDPNIGDIRIEDTAKMPTPDSFPRFQRVVQHISWAPVVIELTWK